MRRLSRKTKELQGTLERSREHGVTLHYSRCQGVPEAPHHLDEYGSRVWLSCAQELFEKQLLYTCDLPQLETFCEAAMLKKIAMRKLKDEKEPGSENTKWNNWFKRWKDAANIMDIYSKKFGFSLLDKTRITIPESDDFNPESLLK